MHSIVTGYAKECNDYLRSKKKPIQLSKILPNINICQGIGNLGYLSIIECAFSMTCFAVNP